MSKKYNFEKKFNMFVSIFAAVLFGILVITSATRPEFAVLNQNGSYAGILLLIFVILVLGFISFFPIIMSTTSYLKLKDDTLSRVYFGIRLWSIKVADITDIYRGNLAGASYALQVGRGLTLRTQVGDKNYWKTAPEPLLDEGQLISDLTGFNQNIKLHNDPADLRKAWGFPL